jgi:hypothetical protein
MSVIKLNKPGANFGAGAGVLASQIQENIHSGGYSTESADAIKWLQEGSFESRVNLSTVAENLKGVLEPNNTEATYKNPAGMAAASFIASFAQRPADLLTLQVSTESKQLGNGVRYAHADGMEFDSEYSKESFDNQSLIDHLPISIGLNYKIARQGPAMEMVYRTVPLTPEQGGIDITIPNLYVQNTLRHDLDGSESDFGLRRVMDSAIDYTVLHDNSTQLIPGYSDVSKDNFVAEAVVEPFDYVSGRRTVKTSALLVNKTVNIFGLGQSDSISRVGQADYTEALDRNIGVADVYLGLGADTIVFDTKGLPFSRFVKLPEQGGRQLSLNFVLTSLKIDKNTTNYKGEALTGAVFTTIKDGGYSVRLKTRLNGNSDVERGTIDVSTTSMEVMYIENEAGERIPLTSGVGKTIVDGLAQLKVVGWWPDARLTNTNHRHLGLMLNVRNVTERLLTRQRSPFFVPYPLSENRDQTVMDWLTFAVSSYINNEAVGTLIGYHERLMRLTGGLRGEMTAGDFEINALPIEGIGRYLVNPYVQELTVDLMETAQSQETVANVENGVAVLVNTLRSVAFDILQKTNYENACRYMDGGEVAQPFRFGLVTSKQIERFMTISGDSRTLGAGLKYQLESDVDARLRDVMYMVIVRDGEGIDALSSGAMLLTPTLVSTISVTRDGRPVNEAVVQPRFQHYNFCPIIVKVNVEGVSELLEQTLPFRVKLTEAAAGEGGTGAGTGGTGGTGGTDAGGDDTGGGTVTP